MKKICFLFLLVVLSFAASSQNPYDLASVPDTFKKKANVIVHLENINLEVESLDRAVVRIKRVFTVLSEEGRQALFFNEATSKTVQLDNVDIKVYDKTGKQVGKYKKKDLTTVAYGEGLIDDGYITYLRITPPSYPVTVEYNYDQVLKTTLFLPDFYLISPKEAVMQASYTARIPQDFKIRYKAKFTNIQPVISSEGKYQTYQWAVKNLAPIEYEAGGESGGSRLPHISIQSLQFSHFGYKGDLSSWKTFGNWINELCKDLEELPQERQDFFKQLVKDAPDEREKVRRVYDYLQDNFRYVSIQLGIGGYKPFSAKFTDEKKYGDCKALSYYMKCALQSVGIRSHVAVINAEYNREPVDPDFPTNKFNHMILCVPGKKDSIWLECTSQTAEFGQLGSFTENRNALLITETGGALVATPRSEARANIFETHTLVKIDNDLSAITETKIKTTGEYSELIAAILKENIDDQKRAIVGYLGYKQPDDFEFVSKSSHEALLKLAIRKINEFNAGTKFFIGPRINKMWTSKLPVYEKRTQDFYFHHPFHQSDTTVMVLPAGFTVDALPKEKELKCDYGYYKASSWFNQAENSVYTATTLVLNKHKILAKDYGRVKTFFDDVVQDDAQRLVIKGTPGSGEKKAF
jgi:hypothetical protein